MKPHSSHLVLGSLSYEIIWGWKESVFPLSLLQRNRFYTQTLGVRNVSVLTDPLNVYLLCGWSKPPTRKQLLTCAHKSTWQDRGGFKITSISWPTAVEIPPLVVKCWLLVLEETANLYLKWRFSGMETMPRARKGKIRSCGKLKFIMENRENSLEHR